MEEVLDLHKQIKQLKQALNKAQNTANYYKRQNTLLTKRVQELEAANQATKKKIKRLSESPKVPLKYNTFLNKILTVQH